LGITGGHAIKGAGNGNAKVITTLNELLQTCHDGTKGFRACAKDVKSTKLVPVFEAVRGVRRGATELAAEIRKLGGEPASGGSVSGALYRVWTDLVSTLSGHSEKAVLEQCERAEDEPRKFTRKQLLLIFLRLSIVGHAAIRGSQRNHDRIRKLRDELSA